MRSASSRLFSICRRQCRQRSLPSRFPGGSSFSSPPTFSPYISLLSTSFSRFSFFVFLLTSQRLTRGERASPPPSCPSRLSSLQCRGPFLRRGSQWHGGVAAGSGCESIRPASRVRPAPLPPKLLPCSPRFYVSLFLCFPAGVAKGGRRSRGSLPYTSLTRRCTFLRYFCFSFFFSLFSHRFLLAVSVSYVDTFWRSGQKGIHIQYHRNGAQHIAGAANA